MTEIWENLNPRVLVWLRVSGLTPADIYRKSGESVPLVPDSERGERGKRQMWTIVYSQWLMQRWTEWATELGFKRADGNPAHQVALLSGHTDAEFDAWLKAWRPA